ncbi:MAG: helix-turn-helix domain-containing protein [Bifidobacteriaceae bacterium]|jgi:transposase|nr:helix-turn-helix domain-containing protein [Bifidobacteriaceae bacterium]
MPRPRQHAVTLTAKDRRLLKKTVSAGAHPAREIARAQILLALDEARGPAPRRRDVAERLGVSEGTVRKVAKEFNDRAGDVKAVIRRKKRATPPVPPKVTGDVEARIIALACTAPPEGRSRWTLRLLERRVLLTEGIPPLDHSTIGRVLKKGI